MSSHLDNVGDEIAADAAHIDAALHRVLTKIRVFDQGTGWANQGFRSCAAWLSWRVGWTDGTAREHVRVANALGSLPRIDRALERGELSYCKVRAITRVATTDNEQVLLEQAQLLTGVQLEALCRKYASVRDHDDPANSGPRNDVERRYVTRQDREDGMVVIKAVLHPDEAAMVWVALERVAADRCRARGTVTTEPNTASTEENTASTAAESEPTGTTGNSESVPAGTPSSESAAVDRVEIETTPATSADGSDRNVPAGTPHRNVPAGTPHRNVPAGTLHRTAPAGANGSAFESVRQARAIAFDRADALVEIAEQLLRGKAPLRSPTELVISVPLETLLKASTSLVNPCDIATTADGTGLSMHAIRRIACDCGVVPLIEGTDKNTAQAGRKTRVIRGAVKRALFNRDTTCRFPGCQTRCFLQGHHLEHWLDGGPTILPNLLGLCSFHHRFVHEYGVSIELDANTNIVTVREPNGRSFSSVAPAVTSDELGWPNIYERNERFAITADTQSCWDATPVDYPELVDHLLRTDDRARAQA